MSGEGEAALRVVLERIAGMAGRSTPIWNVCADALCWARPHCARCGTSSQTGDVYPCPEHAPKDFARGFKAARDACIKWVADNCGTMNGNTMARDPALAIDNATNLSQPAPVVKGTPVPLNSVEDGSRLDWLGEDLQRLEDVRERLEAMPDGTPLRYVIDLIRLEDAEQDEGARDL